jgi:ABC-type antimicrobial peptide transport system permease subunit
MTGGLSIGTIVAAFLANANPKDPLTLTLVSVTLAGVTLAASAWPARQATRVDPLIALKTE